MLGEIGGLVKLRSRLRRLLVPKQMSLMGVKFSDQRCKWQVGIFGKRGIRYASLYCQKQKAVP
jgi:hypothetical protein